MQVFSGIQELLPGLLLAGYANQHRVAQQQSTVPTVGHLEVEVKFVLMLALTLGNMHIPIYHNGMLTPLVHATNRQMHR